MFPQKLRPRPAGNTTMGIGRYGAHFPILREVFQSICSTPYWTETATADARQNYKDQAKREVSIQV